MKNALNERVATSAVFVVPGRIDWAALAAQKRWLLQHAETCAQAAGLVHMLDAIQDAAVDLAGVPEDVVFPNNSQGKN